MCIGVSTFSQKQYPLFLAKPPLLNLQTAQPPPPLLDTHPLTKFLVKSSQFEFVVAAEENIFVYKSFLSLNISDFRVFLCKNCSPPPTLKNVTPFFLATPSKNWCPVKPNPLNLKT